MHHEVVFNCKTTMQREGKCEKMRQQSSGEGVGDARIGRCTLYLAQTQRIPYKPW